MRFFLRARVCGVLCSAQLLLLYCHSSLARALPHPPSLTYTPLSPGDVGAIGRLTVVPNEGVILDLKGVQYSGTIIPCCTLMVVGMSGAEARVESLVSDFVQVEHLGNVLESLGGALTSGVVDPSLLDFEDLACSEAGGGEGSGEEEGEEGEEGGASASGGGGRKRKGSGGGGGGGGAGKRARAGEEGSEGEDQGGGTAAGKKQRARASKMAKKAAAAAIKGAFGRKVTVKGKGRKKQ